jgi:hypothetical protein
MLFDPSACDEIRMISLPEHSARTNRSRPELPPAAPDGERKVTGGSAPKNLREVRERQ